MIKTLILLFVWLSTSGFFLEWVQNQTPVTSFEIGRKPQVGTYAVIAQPAGTVRTYQDTDTALKGGSTYCYQVTGFNNTTKYAPSSEVCMMFAGVRVYPKQGQTVLISRRDNDGASTISLLVNANENVVQGSVPKAGSLVVNTRPRISVLVSKRAGSGASTISFLVNKSEVVTVYGVKQ